LRENVPAFSEFDLRGFSLSKFAPQNSMADERDSVISSGKMEL
jgi:hypothetical protein